MNIGMTKRDIAGFLNVDTKTLYNWEKNKPNLYITVMKGLAFDDLVKKSEQNLEELKEFSNELNKNKKGC
jgi:transcriptional regulator with XRE-family HTH domain